MYLYFLLFFLLLLTIILSIILISLLWTTIVGRIPYLPTQKERITQIIKFANLKKTDKAVDLGSGDGRIVIAFAKQGIEAHGYELNVFYVLLSRWKIQKLGLQKKAFIHWRNFFNVNLKDYDVVTFFAIPYVMENLEKKLKRELKKTARIISISYKFKKWHFKKEEDFVFLYKISP